MDRNAALLADATATRRGLANGDARRRGELAAARAPAGPRTGDPTPTDSKAAQDAPLPARRRVPGDRRRRVARAERRALQSPATTRASRRPLLGFVGRRI